ARDAVGGEHLLEAFPVQHVQARERAAAGAALLHARLVEPAPGIGEREGIEIRAAMGAQEAREFARDAAPPVHHRPEDVENEGLDLLHSTYSFAAGCAQRFSKSQTSGKPMSSQMRPKP